MERSRIVPPIRPTIGQIAKALPKLNELKKLQQKKPNATFTHIIIDATLPEDGQVDANVVDEMLTLAFICGVEAE